MLLEFLAQSCAHLNNRNNFSSKEKLHFFKCQQFSFSCEFTTNSWDSFPTLSNLTESSASIQPVCISLFIIEKAFTVPLYVICVSTLIFVVLHILFFPVIYLLELSHLHFHIALSQHCKGERNTIHNFLMYDISLGCTGMWRTRGHSA